MGSDLKVSCALCLKRARHLGGNGRCPLFDRRPDYTPEALWDIHVRLYPLGCSNFKAGDIRPKPKPPELTEPLFYS